MYKLFKVDAKEDVALENLDKLTHIYSQGSVKEGKLSQWLCGFGQGFVVSGL